MPEEKFEKTRKKLHILTEGEDIPPPIKSFKVLLYDPQNDRYLYNVLVHIDHEAFMLCKDVITFIRCTDDFRK